MADMTTVPTVAITSKSVFGNKRITFGTLTLSEADGSATFPAAGLAVTNAKLGLRGVDFVALSNDTYPYQLTGQVLYSGTGANTPATDDVVYFMAVGYGTK